MLGMKFKMAALLFCALFFSGNAIAWKFYWTPAGGIPDAITGRDGVHCVSRDTQAGDIVSLNSQIMSVKSTSGTSPKCIGSDLPVGALLELSPSSSEFVKVLSSIVIPDEFKRNQLSPQSNKDHLFLLAIDPQQDLGLSLFSINKSMVKIDASQYAADSLKRASSSYENTSETEIEMFTINGVRAWRMSITGIPRTGNYRKPITTFQVLYEGSSQFVMLRQWTGEDRFQAAKGGFEATAASIQNLAGGILGSSRDSNKPSSTLTPTANEIAKKSPQPINKPSGDTASKLETLKQLLAKGLITQKDYDSKKAEILKSL
jgi:hypothetical protein